MLLKKLNKATGKKLDQISAKYLKQAADVLAYPMSKSINLSVKLFLFPEECKTAKLNHYLKPILKTAGLFYLCL